ncbi:MAG: hypothetical protein ACI4P0_02550 [Mailhella sp.]
MAPGFISLGKEKSRRESAVISMKKQHHKHGLEKSRPPEEGKGMAHRGIHGKMIGFHKNGVNAYQCDFS